MNDKEFATQQKRVKALFHKWQTDTGLKWWKIKYVYYREPPLPDTDGSDGPINALMNCSADWKYLQATIRINALLCKDQSDDELEWVVIHELMHVFLNEMREPGIEHEERVASHLADAFGWVRDSALKEKK